MKKILLTLLALLTLTGVQAQRYQGRIQDKDGYVNVRMSASTSSAVKMRLRSGSTIYYSPMKNGWSRVYNSKKSGNPIGYVHTSRIVSADSKTKKNRNTNRTTATGINPTVNTNDNVRTKTTTEGKLRKGIITDPVDNYVNIRKGPGTNYAICGQLLVGADIHYIPYNSGWVKVYEYERFLGYVAKSRVR